MDGGFWLTLVSALWFGVLTSISPCPLATNIAAMSYLAKDAHRPRLVLLRAFLYGVGRLLAYVLLAVIVVTGLIRVPVVARFLERNINLILGPLLLVVALFLFDVIQFGGVSISSGPRLKKMVAHARWFGPAILGFLFALAFCPVSAGLFFGSLVPLAIQVNSRFLLPSLYGLGTVLPVAGFAIVIALGVCSVASFFRAVTTIEFWARRFTGVVFVLAGIYMIIRNWQLYILLFQ